MLDSKVIAPIETTNVAEFVHIGDRERIPS